jgi:hypothetical protein
MLFVPERGRSRRRQGAIRARDVRAADLQAEPRNAVDKQSYFSDTFASSDPMKTAASSEHCCERSEQLDRASSASETIKYATGPAEAGPVVPINGYIRSALVS